MLSYRPQRCPAAARAATVSAPSLAPGDSWTYENGREVRGTRRTTQDTITLTRLDSHVLSIEVHPAGSAAPDRKVLANPDWSRTRSVNGRQTVDNRPLAFPLALGRTWKVDYSEDAPADRRHTREHLAMTDTAVGWENVSVPAGTFRALKIEGNGTWTADLPANTLAASGRAPDGGSFAVTSKQVGRVVSGRHLKTFWYVSEVHRWVKSQEDHYDNNGVRTEQEFSTLMSYALSDRLTAQ